MHIAGNLSLFDNETKAQNIMAYGSTPYVEIDGKIPTSCATLPYNFAHHKIF